MDPEAHAGPSPRAKGPSPFPIVMYIMLLVMVSKQCLWPIADTDPVLCDPENRAVRHSLWNTSIASSLTVAEMTPAQT